MNRILKLFKKQKHPLFWDKWKEAIQVELNSLLKRGVFGKIQETPIGYTPVGYHWVFVRMRNDKGSYSL